jgi:hypothetical protein
MGYGRFKQKNWRDAVARSGDGFDPLLHRLSTADNPASLRCRRKDPSREFCFTEVIVHPRGIPPRLAGHGPTLLAGLSRFVDLKLIDQQAFRSGAVSMRYERRNSPR